MTRNNNLVYVAMLTYNLTEFLSFDENLIGVYTTQEKAIQACNTAAETTLTFDHTPIRGGYWNAESDTYNPLRPTWFYVFPCELG